MNFQSFNQFSLTSAQEMSVVGGAKPVSAPVVTLPTDVSVALPSVTLPVIDTTILGAPVVAEPIVSRPTR